ncbi:phosphatase protein [Spatholobus suberectus]|nr:phosphatase protein [Spatholobus suberectus]
MAHLLGYDPCSHFSRALSHHPSISSSEVNRNIGFTLKACFDANGGDNANRVFVKEKKKPYGFACLPHPPLLGDLEKGISVRDDGCDATHIDVEDKSLGGSPTKPFCFPDQQLPQKLVVAVDVDEVLGNFVSALNEFIADRYSSNYSVSEYHVYEFFKIWNCSRDEANTRVHEFFETPYFKSGIQPIPGAQTVLQKLSRFCNLSVVTSRQNAIKDHTLEWIEKHFSGLFQEIHFGNHFALDGVSRPKSEICGSLNAKVLIDDNPRYAIECAEAGIRVLLFDYENSYPWSKTESADQHPLVNKVKNWEEVEQQLMSLIAS